MSEDYVAIVMYGLETGILAVVSSGKSGECVSFTKESSFKRILKQIKLGWNANHYKLLLIQDPGSIEVLVKEYCKFNGISPPSRSDLKEKTALAFKLKRYLLNRRNHFPGMEFQVVKPHFDYDKGDIIMKKETPPFGRVKNGVLYISQEDMEAYIEDSFEEYMESEYMILCNEADDLEMEEKFDEALEVIEKAIKMEPDQLYAWFVKGNIFNSMEQYDEAMVCHDKTISMDPTYTLGYLGKGDVFQELDLFKEAIKQYDKVLEIDPTDESALTSKGLALEALGKFQEALDCYDAAIEVFPASIVAWEFKLSLLAELGRLDEMIASCDEYIEQYPDEPFFVECKKLAIEIITNISSIKSKPKPKP